MTKEATVSTETREHKSLQIPSARERLAAIDGFSKNHKRGRKKP
jgi:hypothetical protein